MTRDPVTIYHNPACGTSRAVLTLLRERGLAPRVVEYLKAGWTREQLDRLFKAMGKRPRDLLRSRGTPAAELDLLDGDATDDAILEAMAAHPILVERPIVVTARGAVLARPPEAVLDIL